MDGARFDQSQKALASSAGRRDTLRSLSAAGMSLLVGLGLADGGDARKAKTQEGGNGRRPADAHADGKGKGKGKGKRGPAGPTGPTGPTGPASGGTGNQGPTGPTGPSSPAPASVIRFGPEKRETAGFLGTIAECQPGEHAVGGGYDLDLNSNQSINFLASSPSPRINGSVPTAWVAEVNTATVGETRIRAYVICVPD